MNVYEILVPAEFDSQVHRIWDNVVLSIAAGLTIMKSAKGKWVSLDGTVQEKMIPVRIACSEEQIQKIAEFTKTHYTQKAVMYYKVGHDAVIL